MCALSLVLAALRGRSSGACFCVCFFVGFRWHEPSDQTVAELAVTAPKSLSSLAKVAPGGKWTVDGVYFFATYKDLQEAWKDADLVTQSSIVAWDVSQPLAFCLSMVVPSACPCSFTCTPSRVCMRGQKRCASAQNDTLGRFRILKLATSTSFFLTRPCSFTFSPSYSLPLYAYFFLSFVGISVP